MNAAIEQGLDITQLASTLKSMKSSPESSPVQCRRSKKTKEKKESKNVEDKAVAKERETKVGADHLIYMMALFFGLLSQNINKGNYVLVVGQRLFIYE